LVKWWINVSTSPFSGADQRKTGFWTKVTYTYNQHTHNGAAKSAGKVLNARWNRTAPLLSKWCAFMAQAYREKPSGENEENVMLNA